MSSSGTKQDIAGVLVLDPIKCDGRGMCHDAAPGLVQLDEWGYPIMPSGLRSPIDKADMAAAREAVHACPLLALHLEKGER